MKTFMRVIIATMLLFAPVYAFSANLGYMRISLIEGDVQIKTPDSGEWGFASINGPLIEGDQVWAPEGSRVELQLNNGTYIRLDQNSALQILSMDSDSSQFYLSQGGAYIYYDAPRGSVVQIDTPDASVRAFNRANFRIDMADRYSSVAVYKGYVKTENNVGVARINAGQMLSLAQNTNGEVAPMGPADEWEDWNNARNHKVLARRDGGSRYLPAELRAYSADLDENGRWVQVPEYGYCWTPRISIGASWAPYRAGRWIWRGGDYVWVAYEPWGWAPYHYGRWAFVASIGWCWVPPVVGDIYWSPGYVGWVRTPDYVAWVPLAPGERYYGRGYYGRNSVNITNININQVNVTNVYRNVYINNGVTVVNRNSFNTASPTIVNVNKNIIQQKIFVKNNVTVGAPEIKPARGSYFVSTRQVPPAKLPPQPLRNVKLGELKQSRPFIREPDRSVLNPGTRAQSLKVTTVGQPRTPGREKPRLQYIQPAFKGGAGAPVIPGARGEQPLHQTIEKGKGAVPAGAAPKVEKPQFQPTGNRQFGAPARPVPRGEQPQVQTIERGKGVGMPAGAASKIEKPRFQPPGNRQFGAPAGPGPKGEQPQVQSIERDKGMVMPAGAAPKLEKPQSQPTGNRQFGAPAGPGPRVEQPQVQTIERGKGVAVPAGAAPKIERPQYQPTGNRQFGVPAGPVPRGEKPQVQTIERGKGVVAPAGVAPKIEKPQFQPPGNKQFGAPASPVPKGEKPQIQNQEKRKGGAPGGPVLKGEKPQIQPAGKGEHGQPNGPGAKGEKKPDEPVEGTKKGQ